MVAVALMGVSAGRAVVKDAGQGFLMGRPEPPDREVQEARALRFKMSEYVMCWDLHCRRMLVVKE
jgi:hypothetical protein